MDQTCERDSRTIFLSAETSSASRREPAKGSLRNKDPKSSATNLDDAKNLGPSSGEKSCSREDAAVKMKVSAIIYFAQ
jgi:hypothetical protein